MIAAPAVLRARSVAASPRRRYAWAIAALLAFSFGDGAARGIQAVWGLASPYQLLFPLLIPVIIVVLSDSGRVSNRLVGHAVAFAAFACVLLVAQANLFVRFNAAGLAQLLLFVFILILVAHLFSDASDALADAFRRGIVVVHYGLVAYLAVEVVLFWMTGRDVALTALITGQQSPVNAYYGFRPSGVSQEPQWAAFALIASFVAVYLVAPRHAARALAAVVLGAVMVRSATALGFIGALLVVILLERTERSSRSGRGRFLLVAVVGLATLMVLFNARLFAVIGGSDGSTLMRLESARTAWRVIEEGFPLGVGYGNFQDFAVYSRYVAQFIYENSARYYKSDLVFLNYIAELGVAGAVLYGWVAALLGRARHAIVWTYFLALSLLAGTLLIPSVLLVVAAAGLTERDRRRAEEAQRQARRDSLIRQARGEAAPPPALARRVP